LVPMTVEDMSRTRKMVIIWRNCFGSLDHSDTKEHKRSRKFGNGEKSYEGEFVLCRKGLSDTLDGSMFRA
jgi:hypothetical protein